MAAPPPVLSLVDVDELVEEIILRVPPDDPAFLVRAALVCKRWHHIVSDPGFRRRLGKFHRAPPMLGFFYQDAGIARFMSTSSFRRPAFDDRDRRKWRVVDARHGRALFDDKDTIRNSDQCKVVLNLVVSSPITGDARRLPVLRIPDSYCICWNVRLLCAAAGCDHRACPSCAAFTVVLVGMFEHGKMMAFVYSSELQRWSATTSHIKQLIHLEDRRSSTLVGNALCFPSFVSDGSYGILRYDLGKEELSFVSLPPSCPASSVVLMTAEDGGLGFAIMQDLCICMWARGSSCASSKGWTKHKAIELNSFLLVPDSAPSRIIAHVDGTGVLFISVDGVGVFTINLKSRRVRKVLDAGDIRHVIPYISFCTPISIKRAASTDEGPSAGAPNA